jgi:hypothetical protein
VNVRLDVDGNALSPEQVDELREYAENPSPLDVTVPDGVFVSLDTRAVVKTNQLIIKLPGNAPQLFDATLPDGTLVHFERGSVSAAYPGTRSLVSGTSPTPRSR